LYPHGPEQNDNEFGLDDFIYDSRCLEIRTDQLGIPFFSRRHYKLHICRNGKIQLNFEWSVFWPRKFGVYRWFRNMAIMAPLWAATDPYLAFKSGYSKVYHQVYRNTKNNSAQSSYILTTASKHVQLYEKSGNFRNFQASWVLVVTWKNLCPYVYYRRLYYDDNQEILRLNCSWSNTFQAVIITDGFNSFLMYNYPYGGIQWAVAVPCRLQKYYRYYTGVYGIPVAGWNAGDNGQNKLNIKGSGTLHGMCNLDKTPGNTGMMGRHFWRIENNIGKDALEKCFTWAKFQQDANFLDWYKLHIEGNSSLACPCTGWQARLDRGRFVWDWTFSAGFWCYRSRRLKLFTYSSANKTFYFVVNQQCCYSTRLEDFASLKVGPPAGSRIKVTPIYYRRNHSREAYTDQQAYKFCCVDRPELCDRFYFYRPSDNCSDYTPPRRRRGWGDPHFKTLDGGNYTFNGLGEYVLIDAQHGTFQLQARTTLAQGNSTTATIFSAGAAKEVDTDIVEVRVKSGGGIDILINKTFYNGYNSLTNQSKEIGENLSVSKPDENCLEVYFPSTTAVMFCEKKKMLLFVVALGDGYKNTTKGLLGTWNDDPDDEFTLPNGTVLPPSSSLREIHFGFGVKWQINQSQSLFTYADNESVDTFARPDFVPMFADNITWYNESVRLAAVYQCGNDLECLFDVASTNDLSVGMVTKDISIQLVNESNILDNFPPKIVNSPSVINAIINETVRLNITAEDSDTITFRVINKPAGATVNQTGNVLHFTWFVTSSQKFNISFVATDDKGASTTWSPTINMCACDHDGQCVPPEEGDELNTDNKFIYLGCACQGGYTGRFCESDIDACEMNGQPCYAGVECIDLPPPANVSGYTCGPCPSGYTGNGAQCADIDECQSNQANSCGQDCVNIPGSFFCVCYHGYELNADRRTCDDINECLPTNDCMQQCNNTQGSYNCSCNEYFEPDPADWRNCLPANQCAAGHGCSQVCYKVDNQPHCACAANYELQSDGKTCKDIDECDPAKPRNRCDQICENIPGSYKCSCQKGFELTNDGYGCEDINECVNDDLYNCTDEFHKCVNTRGSYKCECDQDLYFIDGKCRGLAKNETTPIPVLPAPRKPSKIEEEQAVQISISSNSQIKWDFQTDKSFKEKMASVTSDYCAQNRTKCALKEERRKRRALFFDLYTADEVHLLPGYPSNSSGTSQVAFYVKQPLGLFIGNISVLPRSTLVDIVITHKSELETAIGANISRVKALFQPTSIPPTKTSTTAKPSPSQATSNDNWKWIAIGISVGVAAIILILILIWCVKKQRKSASKSISATEVVRLESLKTTGPGFHNPAYDSVLTP